jgi:hypothetical protein
VQTEELLGFQILHSLVLAFLEVDLARRAGLDSTGDRRTCLNDVVATRPPLPHKPDHTGSHESAFYNLNVCSITLSKFVLRKL